MKQASAHRPDVRRDQLALLAFERRGLRMLARTLLDGTSSRPAKIAAISTVAAMTLALHDVPDAYAAKLNAPELAIESHEVLAEACRSCDRLAALVNADGGDAAVANEVKHLFATFDREHSRLEKAALKAQAILIRLRDGMRVFSDGGKDPPNSAWLSRVFSSLAR